KLIPLAGYGTATLGPGERISALLTAIAPGPIVEDSQGNLFLGSSNAIYRLSPAGLMERYAPIPAVSLAIDLHDTLYALVNGNQVVRIGANQSTTVVAGTGVVGFSGDGGPAASAQINVAYSIALDAGGNLWIADTNNNRIRKVDGNGTITTV